MPNIETRLASRGIELPQVCPPVANYVSSTRSGNIVQISGQLSTHASGGIKGIVGADCSLADGIIAARPCPINLIAQFKAAAGGELDRSPRETGRASCRERRGPYGESSEVAGSLEKKKKR